MIIEKQKTERDKQELEEEKYSDEERERKEKIYDKCIEDTTKKYGKPKARCFLELL